MDDAGDQKRLYDLHARADARLRVDDVDGALTLLGEALALDPRDEVSRRMRETAERRRDQLAEPAAAPAGGPNSRSDEFTALMRRRRHREAVALAELILSAGPSLHDLRVFWDPWSWPEGLSRAERIERSGLREMERELGEGNPWLLYYRADLKGSDGGFDDYDRIAGLPAQRYGWMLMKAGRAALFSGRFEKAEEWLQRALEACSLDWRARCLLAETRLCLGRTKPAFDAMDAALAQAGPGEKGQVLAWSGELYLWIGEYRKALSLFEAACGLGARHAFAWKGRRC
ncbi:MAG: tetratricopeptide repeat protein [Elusimicrobiota bacterium]|nr:MAG: tetratricopeptide repeat protein [Elusimicrobiota bacterium]